MKTFIYWDNSKGWHHAMLFECAAHCVLEADALLLKNKGINPIKAPWISCQITI